MDAKELRIGNYINIDAPISKEGKLIRCSTYHMNELINKTSKYEPIPLTEEWLLKFGFEYKEVDDAYLIKLDKNVIFIIEEGFNFSLADDIKEYDVGDYFSCGKLLKHVHQLQNLYFALTGEELIIK